jgi:hypothetical protein
VVVTELPDLLEPTANPALPETMVHPVLRALKVLTASQAPMELLVDAARTAQRVLKARPALRGLKVDLKAAKSTDRPANLEDPRDLMIERTAFRASVSIETTLEKEIFMAACKRCGAETQLHSRGIPICGACSEALEAKTTLPPDIPNEAHLGLPRETFTDR